MRKIAIATVLSAVISGPALAATTPVVWQGSFEITGVTGACAAANIALGDFGVSVFRPKLAGSTNTSDAGVSFVFSKSASGYESKSPAIPIAASSAYGASEVTGHAGVASYTGTLTITSRTPGSISAGTPFVTLVGRVTNFVDETGCTVNFKASYSLKS